MGKSRGLILSVFVLCTLLVEAAPVCVFTPPKGWMVADPKSLSPRVKISFLTEGKKEYCPSLNLASEKADLSLEDYLKAVKRIHQKDKNHRWRDLGKIDTAAGEARLTEIESKTPFGPARLLQMIHIHDKVAYVLTASALKSEFAAHSKEFQKAFHSFTIKENLFEMLEKKEQQESLKTALQELLTAWQKSPSSIKSHKVDEDEDFQRAHFLPFQKKVVEEYSEMGSYWQILMLQFAYETLSK